MFEREILLIYKRRRRCIERIRLRCIDSGSERLRSEDSEVTEEMKKKNRERGGQKIKE